MVLKESTIRGDESTGTEETVVQSAVLAASVAAQTINLGKAALKKRPVKSEPSQIPPETQGQFRQDLYESYLDQGVPEDIASEAADAVMLNKDASNSPAIREAHRIISEKNQVDADSEESAEGELDVEDISTEDEQQQWSQQSDGLRIQSAPLRTSTTSDSQETENSDSQQAQSSASPTASTQSVAAPVSAPRPKQRETSQPNLQRPAVAVYGSAEPTPLGTDRQASGQAGETSTSHQVELTQAPSQMSWKDLQQAARDITQETGERPAGRKKAQILPFVQDYYHKQQQSSNKQSDLTDQSRQHYASAAVSAPVTRVPVVRPSTLSLEKNYSAGLEAAKVDSKVANSAASDLVSGKGADSSAAIKAANQQVQQQAKKVVQRSALHQMYYNVLTKQGIGAELAETASKDLAAGKGALSSTNVMQAHKTILDKELKVTGGKTAQSRSWHTHARYVTETDPRKRDVAIAKNAISAGLSQRKVQNMLQLKSPNVAKIQKTEGSTQAVHYLKGIATEAAFKVKAKQRTTALGKNWAKARHKKAGIEV